MIRELLIAFTVAVSLVLFTYYAGFWIAMIAGTVIQP